MVTKTTKAVTSRFQSLKETVTHEIKLGIVIQDQPDGHDVGQALAMEASGPKFDPRTHRKEPGMGDLHAQT